MRKREFPADKLTPAFGGYGDETNDAVIAQTCNWDTHRYDLGNGFGHLALGVDHVYKTRDELRRSGAKVARIMKPMKHGATHTAFIGHPKVYTIDLIDLTRRGQKG